MISAMECDAFTAHIQDRVLRRIFFIDRIDTCKINK